MREGPKTLMSHSAFPEILGHPRKLIQTTRPACICCSGILGRRLGCISAYLIINTLLWLWGILAGNADEDCGIRQGHTPSSIVNSKSVESMHFRDFRGGTFQDRT